MPSPRIFISHSAKDDPALLWQLHDSLVAAGYRVLMDEARLQPGAEWRNEIYLWIQRAHGAVILLSEAASRSDWVYFEIAALVQRKWLEPDFHLMPLLVPPVINTLLGEKRFEPFDLGRLHTETVGADPDRAIARVMNVFQPLLAASGDTPVDRLATVVSRELPRDPHVLERTAHVLDVHVDGQEDTIATPSFIARSLFHAAAEKIRDAVAEVAAGGMSRSQVKKVVDVTVPFWVDPRAVVELVREAARPAGPHRILLLTAQWTQIGRMYAHRAALQYPMKWAVIPVTDSGGEDFVGAIVSEIRAWFRAIDELLEGAKDSEVDSAIAKTAANDPVFVILPAGTTMADAVALRRRYPLCVFILLGADRPEEAPPATDDAILLEPRMEQAREDIIQTQYLACLRLVKNVPG